MTLPITESILRGGLRPNLIAATVSQQRQSLLMRLLRNTHESSNLIELEKDIVNTLGDFAHVEQEYAQDNNMKRVMARLDRPSAPASYTRVYKSVLPDIMTKPSISSPTQRMYKTILQLEKMRTVWALVDQHTTMKDDMYIRPVVKSLMTRIKGYCQETKAWNHEMPSEVKTLLQSMLTELYFSLIQTFRPILYQKERLDFDDDFEDFVYQWKGAFPEEAEVSRYKEEMERIRKDNATIRRNEQAEATSDTKEEEKAHPITKTDKFLQDTSQYEFLKMPMIVALDSRDEDERRRKAMLLIEAMLESPAHAAAMLEYLGFYKWIREKYETGYTLTAYDKFCTKIIMGQEGGAFKNYRLSLNAKRTNYQNYHGWEYTETVKEEYHSFKNDTYLDKDS